MSTKRLFDLLLLIFGAVLLLPLTGIVSILVFCTMGAPVFFVQERPGRNSKPFKMVKFRTMTMAKDEKGALLPDEDRLLPVGKFLRQSSLDELPEILNVLRGEMSLVGPRPLLMEYLEHYTPEQRRRHDVLPGITGWAQICGRNSLSWEEKFRLDLWYVDNRSLWLDMKIIFITFNKVIRRSGIHQDGHATMSKFTGVSHEKR